MNCTFTAKLYIDNSNRLFTRTFNILLKNKLNIKNLTSITLQTNVLLIGILVLGTSQHSRIMDLNDEQQNLRNDVGNKTPIKDRYHFVYGSAFFIGMVILFPWNILITVTTYWNYKFRNVSLDNQTTKQADENEEETLTELQKLYNSYLAIAANVPNATFVILHALFGHHFSRKLRLYGSQVNIFAPQILHYKCPIRRLDINIPQLFLFIRLA